MQKENRAKSNSVRRVHPATDDRVNREAESPSPPAALVPDFAQRGAGPRRNSLNSVGSAHSDSSKDEGRSPGVPIYALGKRRTSINSINSTGSDELSDSERRMSHFSSKQRVKLAAQKESSAKQKNHYELQPNFKVPAILLLSNKLFNKIYGTSKKMFVMAVLSVLMCVIENEIWFSVYMAVENSEIKDTSKLVLSSSQTFRSNMCKLVLSCCTALLGFYITVYYKELLELRKLRQSDVDTHMHDQSTFIKSGLVWWYLLEMLICLIHIPYGMEFSITIEFRSILAFYRGEMIVTLFIFLRLYHAVRVIRDWTLIRFKNAMFLSKLVHVEQNTAYALKVLLHENPVMFVISGLLSTLTLFGYLLRVYDTTARPLPERFGLSQAYWISLLSLTTVGYGDDVPKSHLGRIMVVILVYIGSILIPLQIAIVERLLQFNIQEDRMIRVYRLEQRRHSFQKAAVALVVSWYRSLKEKRTDNLGDHIQKWKKFRMSHASSMVHNATVHNEIDKNLAAVAGALTSCVQELSVSVEKQAHESKDLSRRCNQNLQAMQSIADRLASLLHNSDAAEQLKAKITASQHALHMSREVHHETIIYPIANAPVVSQDSRQLRFVTNDQTIHDDAQSLGRDGHGVASSNDSVQRHSVAFAIDDASEQFQSGKGSSSHSAQASGSRNLSLGNHGSQTNAFDVVAAAHGAQNSLETEAKLSPEIRSSLHTQAPVSNFPLSAQSQDLSDQRDEIQGGRMKLHHQAADKNISHPAAGDSVYSSSQAVSQIPVEVYDHGHTQQRQAPFHQEVYPISRPNTYHNQFADSAFSRSAIAPGFAESQVPNEGLYPPPHNYSPEAIQFHRDRIYEQARPSLNSILRSSPGLIPHSDTARVRPATYYSSKSPPVPLLTRPNSPGPKGFTPVRVKPFNPQGVMSPVQGSAPAGSSSAYAKFLLARSEYKPESVHHSP
jgi:hypothetical protein